MVPRRRIKMGSVFGVVVFYNYYCRFVAAILDLVYDVKAIIISPSLTPNSI